MPVLRVFRGRRVYRTRRLGTHILVTFARRRPDLPREQIRVALPAFLRERITTIVPAVHPDR